jgi:hypothetical protein
VLFIRFTVHSIVSEEAVFVVYYRIRVGVLDDYILSIKVFGCDI